MDERLERIVKTFSRTEYICASIEHQIFNILKAIDKRCETFDHSPF